MNKQFFNESEKIFKGEGKGTQKFQETMKIGCRNNVIYLEDLVYLKSDKNYTIFKMRDGNTIISSKNLKIFEDELKGIPNFVRPHRSFIVNLDYVNDLYFNCRGGELLIFDLKIDISRRKAAEFRKTYRKFLSLTGQNVNSTIRQKTKIRLINK